MTEDKGVKKRIYGKTFGGTEFSIEYWTDDYEIAVNAFFEVEETSKIIEQINLFRIKTDEVRTGFYMPRKGEFKNQMEMLCIAAAASYPRVLSSEFIEKTLGIPYNSYKVYATAKEHGSSEYLSLDDKRGISISIDGIMWLKNHLETGDTKS
jgi:hypothetical protein